MKATIRVTRNFERNLEAIEQFLREQEALPAFGELLDELFTSLLPKLESYPRLGPDFLARRPHSLEGYARLDLILTRLGEGTEVREYISGDYLLLYALRGDQLYLLSIKHHRQLSFDFRGFWAGEG